MRNALKQFWSQHKDKSAYLISASGLITYAIKSWVFIHTLTSMVYDESGYMVRGFLLASGKYSPYADYGPFLDHMPLSFLIPGYAQKIFTPGIGTGRYFTFTIGLLSLLGLWLASRSIGRKWLAAVPIWVMALNPAWIESYSLGYSQVLILFFTSWAIYFAVGRNRKTWQIILAALFAALAGMTRVNMIPVVFFVVLYIFWQHGRKAGLIALASGVIPILLIQVIYWPEILKMWAIYIPKDLMSFIEPFRAPFPFGFKLRSVKTTFTLADSIGNQDHIVWTISNAFWRSVQTNLLPVLGVLITILLWPKRKNWKLGFHFRTGIFLLSLYLSLFAIHNWAALSANSCNYSCLKGYPMFFNNIGMLLIILAISSWGNKIPVWRYVLLGLFLTLFTIGVINGTQIWKISLSDLSHSITSIEIPRMKNMRFLPGTTPLWSFFESKFGIPPKTLDHNLGIFLSWYFPLIICWIFIPIISQVLKKKILLKYEFYQVTSILILVIAILLSPNKHFGGTINTIQCDSNIIKSHQEVGLQLESVIPKGAKVYWGIESWMLFLYIPDIEIYPSQTMLHYTYIDYDTETDVDTLLKFGYWNEELKEQWINEADYIIVNGQNYKPEWKSRVESGELILYDITAPVETCRGDDSRIMVLRPNTGND